MCIYSQNFSSNYASITHMRQRFEAQLQLGATPISDIDCYQSRDNQTAIFKALQWIYTTPEVNEEIYQLLESVMPKTKSKAGRKGMDLWTILVLGVIRLNQGLTYDKLYYSTKNDSLLRSMIGISEFDRSQLFSLTTLKENISLLNPDIFDKLNQIILKHGLKIFSTSTTPQRLKTDSYVLESNVHFPTDLNLALDSARKSILDSKKLAQELGLQGWRKSNSLFKKVKKSYLKLTRIQHGGGKNKEQRLAEALDNYLEILEQIYSKTSQWLLAEDLLKHLTDPNLQGIYEKIKQWQYYLEKHIELINRRLKKGESIPHDEKVFSIFESHVEWINKGKKRPNVELGHRLLITTNQDGFIVDHKALENQTDVESLPELIDRLKENQALENKTIYSHSFDKGFYSKSNKEKAKEFTDLVVIPKRGKLNESEKEEQTGKEWKKLRHQHSAIESNINGLEHQGLGVCPDKGLENYKRYAGLGVIAYNLHNLGKKMQQAEAKEEKRLRKRIMKLSRAA